jgi:TfoX/Sxy family transcriptional regulator of competence genes
MPAKKPVKPSSPEYTKALDLYERTVATIPDVERKGDTMPYTSLNGNMFSLLTRTGTLALRLPGVEREAFLAKHKTQLTVQYGATMPEYVDVPAAVLADAKAMKKYFAASYAYAKTLRTKPTTKAKKRR